MEHAQRSKAMPLIIAAVFVAYGVYALVQSRASPQVLGVLVALVSVVGGVGLALDSVWSKYCIYLVSAAVVGTWLYSTIAYVIRQGWPYPTAVQTLISLLPGLSIVVIAAGSSYVVARHFRRG